MNPQSLKRATDYIQDWLAFRYKYLDIPGFTVAIAHKGTVVFNESYGYADLAKKQKLTPHHVFRIASHSKTFTATALMQLQEKKKLRIDDYVSDHLLWLKDHPDKRFSHVTIRQLMSHSAGITRDGHDSNYWQLLRTFPTKEEFIDELMHAELVYDVNENMKYSNFGFTLLGLVIEECSGLSYDSYLNKYIFQPLKLENTGTDYDPKARNTTGYSRIDTKKVRHPIASPPTNAMSSATGLYSTSEDLCTFYSAQKVGTGKLLIDESKKEMQRIQWRVTNNSYQEYGLGLGIENYKDTKIIGHGGGFPGQITQTFLVPSMDLVITVLTNCIDGPAYMMSKGILSVLQTFNSYGPQKNKKYASEFEGRFASMWGYTDLVAFKDVVLSNYPHSWYPFDDVDTLAYINDTTLRITKSDGYASLGETVTYHRNESGKITSITYGGSLLLPESLYNSRLP